MRLLDLVLNVLENDKAEQIVSIDIRKRSVLGDHIVVATGRSARQISALADKLQRRIKQATGHLSAIEGKEMSDWVLIDAGDVIIHLFRPEVRAFYQLEAMWDSDIAQPPTP